MLDAETRTSLRYLVPTVVFGLVTALEGYVSPGVYPAVYAFKMLAVAASLFACRASLRDIRPTARVVLPAVAIGFVVFVVWVGLDRLVPYPHAGSRTAFDPFASIPDAGTRLAFLAVRLLGLAVIVPVMEELFLRSYVLRVVTNQDFLSVPFGEYSWPAFWAVAGLSALTHPEWLAAIITSVLYTWVLGRTKSLFACVLAHAVTNASLGAYVLSTHSFQYW